MIILLFVPHNGNSRWIIGNILDIKSSTWKDKAQWWL